MAWKLSSLEVVPEGRPSRTTEPFQIALADACRSDFGVAFMLVVARIIIGLAASQVAVSIFHARGRDPYAYEPASRSVVVRFLHWDAALYQTIIQHGYQRHPIPINSRLFAFFPFYPIIARVVHEVGLSFAWAAVTTSWVSFFVATWGLIALARAIWPDISAFRVAFLFVWFPVSVFLISGYSESTFIALVAWSLWALVKDRVILSSLLAAMASATRLEGASLGLVILLYLLQKRRPFAAVSAFLASEIGIIAYSVFLGIWTGSPIAYITVEKYWNRHLTFPLYPVLWSLHALISGSLSFASLPKWNVAIVYLLDDLGIVAAVTALCALIWGTLSRNRKPYRSTELWILAAFALVYLVTVLSSAPYGGTSPEAAARFVMADVPLFLAPTFLRHSTWLLVAAVVVVLAIVLQALFNLGYWLT